jgi:hypothetical protein
LGQFRTEKEKNMKKIARKAIVVAAFLAMGAVGSASAQTWWINGVLYGNVCRSGLVYFVYLPANMQQVGSACPVRDNFGNVIAQGVVTNE